MSESRYTIVMNSPGPGNPLTQLVMDRDTGRFLGGFGANYYRPWVFPLYTPSGLTVIQEFAYDHPFHNGVFVGQHPVTVNGRVGNFWAMPPRRDATDAIFTQVGRMDILAQPTAEAHEQGMRFRVESVWRDENEEPLIDEVRTVEISALEDATVCDMTSQKIASYGAVEYTKTKYGSIGIRVEPRLLPAFGAIIMGDSGRRGKANVVTETESDYVAYENDLSGHGRFGVFLSLPYEGKRGPWFIRDYGMAMHNPTWTQSITTPKDESWIVSLRVVAYDGELTEERARRWCALPLAT